MEASAIGKEVISELIWIFNFPLSGVSACIACIGFIIRPHVIKITVTICRKICRVH